MAVPAHATEADYVRQGIEKYLYLFQGGLGDWIVLLSLGAGVICLLRKSFKSAVGFLFLIAGVVVLRILISVLFR